MPVKLEKTAQMIYEQGPVNKALMRNICDILNDQVGANVTELENYPSNYGVEVPLKECTEHAGRVLADLACGFGSDYAPYLDFSDIHFHGQEIQKCANALARAAELTNPSGTEARKKL
jgi:hypothetical protein